MISIQLVEIPENEQVHSRQIVLPIEGGTIGRAYGCTIQLPDFSMHLSRVHAQIDRDEKGRYQIVNQSTNGMHINNKFSPRGRYHHISDGDIWKIGDYILLVTDVAGLGLASEEISTSPIVENHVIQEPPFGIDEFDLTDSEVFEAMKFRSNKSFDRAETKHGNHSSNTDVKPNQFSSKSAMEKVNLGIDPFEDAQLAPNFVGENPILESQTTVPDGFQQQIQQLTTALSQQGNSFGPQNYYLLMECLQTSMDQFIEELSPEHLEEQFNSYLSGWGNWDKKYWQLYKKQFKRKIDRNEFHRQFGFIFMEELRSKK